MEHSRLRIESMYIATNVLHIKDQMIYFYAGLGGGLLSITGFSTIALSFGKRKSLALAFATTGSMIGSCIFPYIFQSSIDAYGWRGTFLIYGGYLFNTFVGAYILRLCVSDEIKYEKRSLRSILDLKVFFIPAFKFYLLANFLRGIFGK